MQKYLPLKIRLAYASGMAGFSILINIIGVMLTYFYVSPNSEGWPPLISQTPLLWIISSFALITTAGRLVDAFYDPFLGQLSDRSKNRRGRRIPFMMWSAVPAAILCVLVFFPPDRAGTAANAWWLLATLTPFFVASTTYVIPLYALLPELARTPAARVKLSTLQQTGFVTGIVLSALTNNIAEAFQKFFHVADPLQAVQYAICLLCAIAVVFMLVPVFLIDEKKYCVGEPSHMKLGPALRTTFKNRNFIFYIIANFSWYMALYIITSGLVYFVTVLAQKDKSLGGVLMGTMVAVSLLFYPFISSWVEKHGKKKLVLLAFFVFAVVCACVYGLGKFPLPIMVQLFAFVIIASFPLASLGILPPAILGDIARADADESGENREGLYFAVNYFFVKLGQTAGIAVFAILTLYGKDVGHDLGLRLSGVVVGVLCLVAMVLFTFFREERSGKAKIPKDE